MRCGKCQHEMNPGAKFCTHCGWKVEDSAPQIPNVNRCGVCNNPLNVGALFCNVCGSPTGAPAPDQRAVHEKKKVNIAAIILSIALTISLIAGGFATYLYLSEDEDIVAETDADEEKDEKDNKDEKEEEESEESSEENAFPEKEDASEESPENEISEEDIFQEADNGEDGYIFPSDKELIFSDDLKDLSQAQVALIRNEIYARRGYIFKTEPYITYFNTKSWYVPNENFSENDFNLIEKTNKEFLVKYEKEKGWR